MGSASTIQALDAQIMGALSSVGLADAGSTFSPVIGLSVECTAIISQDFAAFGYESEVGEDHYIVTVQVAEVPFINRNDTFTVDGNTYRVDSEINSDQSIHSYEVVKV